MKLKTIAEKLTGIQKIEGDLSLQINGITYDSKAVKDGYIFIAVEGARFDGRDFINDALDRGACVVILEDEPNNSILKKGYTYIYVSNARKALSEVSFAFYGDISNQMYLAGITGTNGKTTTSYLLESLFKIKFGQTGIIGTINYRFGERLIPAVNTTPSVVDIYFLLNNMRDSGVSSCVLEVSSHALEQGRIDTLHFDTAVFTNITAEHMDYHKNIENYFKAKLELFKKIKHGGYAIVNKDDPYSERIIEAVKQERKANVISYGIEKKYADIVAKDIQLSNKGVKFKIDSSRLVRLWRARSNNTNIYIKSPLFGRHNVYNILAAFACGIAAGMNIEDIKSGIESISCLPGRLERIDCGQDFMVFVDYAHTENGIENVLKALRALKPKRILTVLGCGGDRDKFKRPNMGKLSCELSEKVFITSDNPRSEEPIDIVNEIISGISKDKNNYAVEVNRFNAIKNALREAKKGDIVLVAGKGHETYQILKNSILPFDDREVVKRILKGDVPLGDTLH